MALGSDLSLFSSKYHPLSQEDSKGEDGEREQTVSIRQMRYLSLLIQIFPWITSLLFAALYIIAVYQNLHRSTVKCFDNDLNAPLIYEDRTYLSDAYGDAYDIYSPNNPNADEVWMSLRMDKMTAVSIEEYSHMLPERPTAPLYGGQEGYSVLLEVFHQLHCLDSIRREYYTGGNSSVLTKGFSEPGGHGAHCFSYLLQTILCHGDVGIMTTRWHERMQAFHANFNITKTCRNFDIIREWALARRPKFEAPE